ncbi:MAG: ABC-F family ATP-binding cassette domain-containing protein [Prosthecobacter sp.]|uniref:ribosomal protection-like ABC-F family protein n=1 Tax=Prosthecobacter sp. TaxID=1965333 RepID=UPI0025D7E619|nr:ABC-F family ATP-binding cassette domain-containing protein [Prosthecobacter sp.]MCF7786944.1 ABC-F family ATP-binding cassette domain-containing protein [Prosthecobacter sp.]
MLSVSNVSKTYAGRTLFSQVSFHINRGEKIGLIGPNGAGKSTLFSLLLRDTVPDDGQVVMERGITFGFLPQESAPIEDVTVLELATGHIDENSRWEVEPKAKRILSGLAFRESDFERNARTLSGGWVMRAHLARLLVQEPDLLLLDEPTNHLDLESLIWFQNYLQSYPGAILMISHDREFLNALCDSILEVAHSKITRYTGNFDDYTREKAARMEQLQGAYDNQQRELAKMQAWVDKFKAKANFASRAQDKAKMIDRIEKVDAPVADAKTVKFRFPQPPRSGQRVIRVKDVDFAYGAQPVYTGLDLEIERGQCTVLVGPNGAGKSTLLKLLAGALTPQAGVCELGHNVKLGYFAQYRGDVLNMKHTVLQSAMDLPSRPGENMCRTLLGSFLFHGDDVFKPVGVLSGGEKSRLVLVRLLLDPPNFLLMDEPTTHLDMGSIDALIGALAQYEGTLVFISHDVHFIRQMAKHVLHVSAGVITPYAGDYQYYLDKSKAGSAREALTATLHNAQPTNFSAPSAKEPPKSKQQRRAEADARNAYSKAKKELDLRIFKIEQELTALDKRKHEIVNLLQEEATYADAAQFRVLSAELEAVETKIPKFTSDWEKATEELEKLTPVDAK